MEWLRSRLTDAVNSISPRKFPQPTNPETDRSSSKIKQNKSVTCFGSPSEGNEHALTQRIPLFPSKPMWLDQQTPQEALWESISQNSLSECRSLIQTSRNKESHININQGTGMQQWTFLHFASHLGLKPICETLLDYGLEIDINSRDGFLRTPLHLACKNGHKSVVKVLVRSGAHDDLVDLSGLTALDLVNTNAHQDISKWMLKRRASTRPSQKIPVRFLSRPRRRTLLAPKPIALFPPEEIESDKRKLHFNDFTVLKTLDKDYYLVQKEDSGKIYSMKILGKDQADAALNERNVLAHIRHEFIIELKYTFQTPDFFVLILEYCPGASLRSFLKKQRKIPQWQVKLYACELVVALEELHKQGIVYRDLQLENVLVDSSGHLKLSNFGFSQKLNGKELHESLTESSFALGKSIDWYMFGVLLYELLMGTTLTEVMQFSRDLSIETTSLLEQLLRREKDQRLGARRDAEEVKEHDYFSGVDWEQVVSLQLSPPVPDFPMFEIFQPMDLSGIYGVYDRNSVINPVKGWTFISDR